MMTSHHFVKEKNRVTPSVTAPRVIGLPTLVTPLLKSVALNDLKRHCGGYFMLIYQKREVSRPSIRHTGWN